MALSRTGVGREREEREKGKDSGGVIPAKPSAAVIQGSLINSGRSGVAAGCPGSRIGDDPGYLQST